MLTAIEQESTTFVEDSDISPSGPSEAQEIKSAALNAFPLRYSSPLGVPFGNKRLLGTNALGKKTPNN